MDSNERSTASQSDTTVRPLQRYNRDAERLCPICAGAENDPRGDEIRCAGFITARGEQAYCTRTPSPTKKDIGYSHRLRGNCLCGAKHQRPAWWAVMRTQYEIKRLDGTLVATHIRTDHLNSGEKTYRWERNGSLGLGGVPITGLPLYGTELLGMADPKVPIIITEGEGAAGALADLGVLAVATVTGASSTHGPDAFKPLLPFTVILWPDNDEAGRSHMDKTAAVLREIGHQDVRLLTWPEAPDTGDAKDFVEQGGTVEQFDALVAGAVEPDGLQQDDLSETLATFLSEEDAPTEYIIPELVPAGVIALCHGEPRARKSLVAFELGLSANTGTAAFGLARFQPSKPVPVWYIQEEDPRSLTRKRLGRLIRERCGSVIPPMLVTVRRGVNLDEPLYVNEVIATCRRNGIKMLVLDAARRLSAKTDEGPTKVRELMAVLRRIVDEAGVSIVIVHHDVKPPVMGQDQRRRSQRASGGDWFAGSECPIHIERLTEADSLVFPQDYKFTADPAPFYFEIKIDRGLISRLTGTNKTVEVAEQAGKRGKLLEWLRANPDSSKTQMKAAGFGWESIARILDDLIKEGLVDFKPGRQKDSKLYFVPVSGSQDDS